MTIASDGIIRMTEAAFKSMHESAELQASDIRDLESQLREARELLEHFRYIASRPECDCNWCVRRAKFLERGKADGETKS